MAAQPKYSIEEILKTRDVVHSAPQLIVNEYTMIQELYHCIYMAENYLGVYNDTKLPDAISRAVKDYASALPYIEKYGDEWCKEQMAKLKDMIVQFL